MEEKMIGQRLLYTLDSYKSFKYKDGEEEKEGQRQYSLDIPYGAPYEEVYSVLEEFVQTIKENEKQAKERAEAEKLQKEKGEVSAQEVQE